jgi:hypothetical protein
MNGCENLVTISFRFWMSRFFEFLLKLGTVRILKANVQSFSSGVGSFCGYPSQAR